MLKPKNGVLNLQGNILDYIRFGTGPKNLVMIPGLGDGLKTVRGMAIPFALLYRALAKDFTVLCSAGKEIFRQEPPPGTWLKR